MSKVLYIKANPKKDAESNTFQLANTFMEEYIKHNPDDEIITLDLYKENIRALDSEMLYNMQNGIKDEVYQQAQLFASADKYVIAAPMWNLTVPSILISYFSYVAYRGISFRYTETGVEGLLNDKPRKVMHIVTRGGLYSRGPEAKNELGDRYIRAIMEFMGINDVQTLAVELLEVLQGEELEKALAKGHAEARQLAQKF